MLWSFPFLDKLQFPPTIFRWDLTQSFLVLFQIPSPPAPPPLCFPQLLEQLFFFFEYLVTIFPSSPSPHLTRIYLRILQSDSKTAYCCKQCLISDLYFSAKNMGISHLCFSISLCSISTCRTQSTASLSESDLFLANTARRLFKPAKQKRKTKSKTKLHFWVYLGGQRFNV